MTGCSTLVLLLLLTILWRVSERRTLPPTREETVNVALLIVAVVLGAAFLAAALLR